MEIESDVFDRWGEALVGGYQIVPNQLFRLQHQLRLTSHQIVILLNLSMHWWKKSDLPFVSTEIMAKRMGVTRRTVERQLKRLCERGFVQRTKAGYKTIYDLSGLVAKLETMPPAVIKNSKLAEKISERRMKREAALEETTGN